MRQQSDLRPYQERIATALYENDEHLCVMRPGSGKTIAALTAIVDLLREGVIRHALIIAPKRVARVVWPDEIESWAHTHHLNYAILTGDPRYRWGALRQAHRREITIVGIDVLPWLIEQLELMVKESDQPRPHPIYDLLVIDEASRLRKPTGVRAKALAKHAHHWKMIWGLSGTLRPSSALDLFMPARIVTRGKLWGRSFYQWRKERFYPADFMGYDWKPLPGAEDQINAEIAPLTVMVDESEMPKVEPTIVIDRVDLPAGVRIQYHEMARQLLTRTKDGDHVLAANAAVATGKLAQMANGFVYGNLDDQNPDEKAETHVLHSAKREWLRDLLEERTDPVLVIYEYQADLEMLREEVQRALGAELRYLGAGVSDKQAAANIKDWNAGSIPVMGLHPASGGHGLNLQHGGADMAWICPNWSPEFWEQTIARLARPGQKRPVVVRICVAAGTVDELKLDRVHHKMSAQEAFEAWVKRWHAEKRAA